MDYSDPRDRPADILDDAPRAVQLGQAIELALLQDTRPAALWLFGPASERLALGCVGKHHPFALCMAAAKLDRADAVEVMLDLGYAPGPTSDDPSLDPFGLKWNWGDLLHACATIGSCAGIELAAHSAHIDSPNSHGWTPLMRACASGEERAALLFLSLGANPLATSRQGQSPIMAAAMGNCPDVLTHLLAAGADAHGEDSFGHSATAYARQHKAEAFLARIEAFEIGQATTQAPPHRRDAL